LQAQSQEHQSHAQVVAVVVVLELLLRVKLAEQVAVGLVARSLSRGRMAQLIQGAAAVAVEPMRLLAALAAPA
jgi:hypothetical protein